MRAIVQRVHSARVEVAGRVCGQIEHGLCAFIGASKEDDAADMRYLVDKLTGLRVFRDDSGKMSRSVQDVNGGILAISQFTVFGDVRRGRRPSFSGAMSPELARPAFATFLELLRQKHPQTETGEFGADMRVVVDNDGPVSILIDSAKTF